MPQPTNKKKKKTGSASGRVPAFQNTFAFRHNPKSKKTATILASPIQYCCQRCHDKIVWRKQYRKYKPLTQPTTCNLCNKRNVTAAYHTVCDDCSTSHPKAIAMLSQWNLPTTSASPDLTDSSQAADTNIDDNVDVLNGSDQSLDISTDRVSEIQKEKEHIKPNSQSIRHIRVCTVCFKQPALPDENVDKHGIGSSEVTGSRPMKLRELKSLQRRQEKQVPTSKKTKNTNNTDSMNTIQNDSNMNEVDEEEEDADVDSNEYNDDDSDHQQDDDDDDEENCDNSDGFDDDDSAYEEKMDTERYNSCTIMERKISPSEAKHTARNVSLVDDDDMNDPFLQAIGGAKNLMIGEAYQNMMLEKRSQPR
jgi:hypothetical protein